MDEKYIQDLYSQLGGKAKFGSFEDFKFLITTDKSYQKDFYNSIGKKTLGEFNDFTSLVSSPVKKKDSSDGTGQPSPEASSTQTGRTKPLSGTEKRRGQKASDGLGGDIIAKIKNVTQKITDLEEEEAVALLSKEFKGQGFTFEETGIGDAMIVRNSAGESIEIDLDPFFSDTEREEANKLRKFLASSKSKEYTEEGSKIFSRPSLTKKDQERLKQVRSKSKELDIITNQEFDYVDDKDSYVDEAKKQVDSETKGEGVWNTIKQTAKGAWNAYLESPVGEAISSAFGEEGKKTRELLKADKTILDKKIREVKSDPKNSKLSDEQVKEKAYKLAVDERADKIRQSATSQYIASLPEDQKKSLELDKILELSSIDESAKEKVSKIKILQKSIELDLDDLKEAVAKYGENSNEANSIRNKAKIKIDDIKKLEASVYGDQEKIGTLEDEVNLLKRNYDGVEGFNAKYTSTVMDMLAGAVEFSGSFSPEYGVVNTASEKIASEIKQKSDELRGLYRVPLESVESASDFVDYASDLLANQAPNLVLMTLTGTASLPVLGVTSAGQKRIEMRSEIESGEQKYSKAQMIFVPMLYGAAEAIPEMNSLNMIRKASRALSALKADDIARRSLTESYTKRFIETGFDNAKDILKEEAAEIFTNTAQNSFDKYILGKEDVSVFDNIEDVIKDTAMFSLMLQGAPHVFGAVSKPFSKPEYTEVLKNNASKLIEIEKQLNDPNISESAKKALKFSADKINSQSESIVDKVLSQMESMPIEQREVIVSIDKKQAELKATASSVIKDKTIESADKKIVLKELKSEFAKIEDERIKILSGEYDPSSETIQQLKNAKAVAAQDKAKTEKVIAEQATQEAKKTTEPVIIVHGAVNGFGLQYSEGINKEEIKTPGDGRGFLPKEQQVLLNQFKSVISKDDVLTNGDKSITILTPSTDNFGRSATNTFEFVIPQGNNSTSKDIQSILEDVMNNTDLKGKELINESVKKVKEYIESNKSAEENIDESLKQTEAENSVSLFQKISDITNKSEMQEFSNQNPDVAFIHNNIESIIKGIDGAKVVEC
jgi:hypothetical protein